MMMESLLFTLLRNLRNKAIGEPIELCLICHQNGRLCHWSDSGNLILVTCEELAYVWSYNAQVNRRIQKRRTGIKLVLSMALRVGVKGGSEGNEIPNNCGLYIECVFLDIEHL